MILIADMKTKRKMIAVDLATHADLAEIAQREGRSIGKQASMYIRAGIFRAVTDLPTATPGRAGGVTPKRGK